MPQKTSPDSSTQKLIVSFQIILWQCDHWKIDIYTRETNQQVPVSTLVKAGFSYKDIPAKRIFSVCLQGSKELQVNLANSHFF